MATFDAWEAAVHPPEDYLMHFRTKGSKNGVRRYQREDGTWTELGLEERREREGWGDSKAERKAQKRVEKAERKQQKMEQRQARKEAKEQRKFERSEAKRKKSLKGLTDEEMKAKLERAKMEAEYRDLTKRKGLIDTGVALVGKYLDYKQGKEARAIEENKQKIEMARLATQRIQAKEATKQAKELTYQSKNKIKVSKNETEQARAEAEKEKYATKGGKIYERKAAYRNAKTNYRQTTIWGAIGKRANNRAKFIQEKRMDPYEEKKRRNTERLANIQLQRDREKTNQTMWGRNSGDEENKKKKK